MRYLMIDPTRIWYQFATNVIVSILIFTMSCTRVNEETVRRIICYVEYELGHAGRFIA